MATSTVAPIANTEVSDQFDPLTNSNNRHSALSNSMSNSSNCSNLSNFSVSSVISNDVFGERMPALASSMSSNIVKNLATERIRLESGVLNGKCHASSFHAAPTKPNTSSITESAGTATTSFPYPAIVLAGRHTCHAAQPTCLTSTAQPGIAVKTASRPNSSVAISHRPTHIDSVAALPVPRCACPAAFSPSAITSMHSYHRRLAQSQSSASSGSTSGCQSSSSSSALYRLDSNGSSTKSSALSPTASLMTNHLSSSTSTSGFSSIRSATSEKVIGPNRSTAADGLSATIVSAPSPASIVRIKSTCSSTSTSSSKSTDESSETGGAHSECSANSSCALVSPTSTASITSNAITSSVIHSGSSQPMSSSGPLSTASFLHYPNIYNPLKNTKNCAKKNKKLIRFMTVCAYVFAVSLVAILLSLYYLFIWNPYTRPTGNLTRTFINSEILFIEKTNYFDVDVSGHPHVIGSAPNSPHLTHNVKVNLTEAKVMVPVAVESRPQPVRRPPSESDAHEPGPIDSEMLHEAHQPEHVLLPVGPAISMDLRVESINSSTTSPTTNVIRTQQSNHVRIETIANSNIISASPKASLLLVNV